VVDALDSVTAWVFDVEVAAICQDTMPAYFLALLPLLISVVMWQWK
jgi:hypothetical protein